MASSDGEYNYNEYYSLCAQRDSAQASYNSTANRIDACKKKIERLKKTRTVLIQAKKDFSSVNNDDKMEFYKKRNIWKGQTFSDFESAGDDLISENNYYYKHSLDATHDAINDEITRLQNQINNEYGLLGRLASAINSLKNEIRNFFN